MKEISGYLEMFPEDIVSSVRLTAGESYLGKREFWAAHFLAQSVEDGELVCEALEVDEDEARELHAEITGSQEWPVFEVAVGGSEILVVYRNFPDDAGVDYLVHPGDGGAPVQVAALEGAFRGPGISWPELAEVARRAAEGGGSVRQAEALLLLAPMMGDASVDGRALQTVASALTRIGARHEVDQLAEVLLKEHLMWDQPEWAVNEEGVRTCDGPHSPRNPDGPMSLSPVDLARISKALPT